MTANLTIVEMTNINDITIDDRILSRPTTSNNNKRKRSSSDTSSTVQNVSENCVITRLTLTAKDLERAKRHHRHIHARLDKKHSDFEILQTEHSKVLRDMRDICQSHSLLENQLQKTRDALECTRDCYNALRTKYAILEEDDDYSILTKHSWKSIRSHQRFLESEQKRISGIIMQKAETEVSEKSIVHEQLSTQYDELRSLLSADLFQPCDICMEHFLVSSKTAWVTIDMAQRIFDCKCLVTKEFQKHMCVGCFVRIVEDEHACMEEASCPYCRTQFQKKDNNSRIIVSDALYDQLIMIKKNLLLQHPFLSSLPESVLSVFFSNEGDTALRNTSRNNEMLQSVPTTPSLTPTTTSDHTQLFTDEEMDVIIY